MAVGRSKGLQREKSVCKSVDVSSKVASCCGVPGLAGRGDLGGLPFFHSIVGRVSACAWQPQAPLPCNQVPCHAPGCTCRGPVRTSLGAWGPGSFHRDLSRGTRSHMTGPALAETAYLSREQPTRENLSARARRLGLNHVGIATIFFPGASTTQPHHQPPSPRDPGTASQPHVQHLIPPSQPPTTTTTLLELHRHGRLCGTGRQVQGGGSPLASMEDGARDGGGPGKLPQTECSQPGAIQETDDEFRSTSWPRRRSRFRWTGSATSTVFLTGR